MVLYVMAVIFALGAVSKMVVAHTYKRLMRQCSNLSSAREGYLKHIKNKYEAIYRANDGVRNCSVFIENQINACRILRIPIQKWDNVAMHMALFCFFAGVGSSFLCFWYSLGVRPIVLHFVAGVLFGVALIMVDGIADTGTRRDILEAFLQDYLENNVSVQIMRGGQAETRKVAVTPQKNGMQDDIFMKKREENEDDEERGHNWKLRERRRKEIDDKYAQESWENNEKREKIEKIRNNEVLRRGIEQIAATRESVEERERRKLTPEEEQLLEDIIKEYLN